ncbi:glycosyltransferase family 2 protein [Nocardioides sp. CFH 31398]|uniref:glycosyltransferase family 2 protein n=1 Tax=Nocardioides sp. CFH 31398 TaxID=2919579 RepID=UPI001F06E9D0|nr:glycosyltransferase family 2 protein [Nocardioides sp. CFH 31398]MCH1867381.1 glycosyltransferase [Nocardioides sp. CFH 31398]MCH1868622.1 glycosyltransferase [Nocardioides sp. CFH 31398]
MSRDSPPSPAPQWLIRVAVLLTVVLGVNYVVWRWLFSVNWNAWWIAVPLVVAETYSIIDALLFGTTVWKVKRRGEAPPPPPDATVDVFVTTYNEPLDLVQRTALAARDIHHPHRTWILDDGSRTELHDWAEAHGIGWIRRSEDWVDRPRHAKAGNINNALMQTEGEFLLILDADQVPAPEILDKTLGWFTDPEVALVQTPQYFVNVPRSDPLGSQAPLFYGPIQQGKDGWNAAFFCGSNAVLRREALMQLGVSRYAQEVETAVRRALKTSDAVLANARDDLDPDDHRLRAAIDEVAAEVRHARAELDAGAALADVTYGFQQRIDAVTDRLVAEDLTALRADLEVIAGLEGAIAEESSPLAVLDEVALDRVTRREWSPLGALETVKALISAVDMSRDDEAQPVMPLATISVTEDMATAMRMHAMGWRSVYHHEVLAHGLAPEDLGSMLTQRLRWAQGTMQVMFRENPLFVKGLSVPQRLMYFSTMWSYLSGFAAVVYVTAPVVYLCFGVLPVQSLSSEFFARLIPFLVVNQLMFLVVGKGVPTWRGQQYSLVLFPTWIKSVTSAFGNVFLGRHLDFSVTPKERPVTDGPQWHLVKPQLIVIGALVVAVALGMVRLAVGQADPLGVWANVAWVLFDLLIFSVVIQAVLYRGPDPEPDPQEHPQEGSTP